MVDEISEMDSENFDELSIEALDEQELNDLDVLKEHYEKVTQPGPLAKAGKAIGGVIPRKVKDFVSNASQEISEQRFYAEAMKVIAKGFGILEEQAARFTVSEKDVINNINRQSDIEIDSLEAICLARSYDIAKTVNANRLPNICFALAEGGGTGAFGFAGIPFNIVLSTFCYYRAVQSIAMFYGYDIKNDSDELALASEVFTTALSPTSNSSEIVGVIGKIMMVTEGEVVKQTVKKGWTAMASRGGVSLLITQMRALAHKSAVTALKKAGEEGLENSIFRSIFEQIGKQLTQKTVQRAVPVVSALIGALFDAGMMNKVLDYANTFYQKRFILEKSNRQKALLEKLESEEKELTTANN